MSKEEKQKLREGLADMVSKVESTEVQMARSILTRLQNIQPSYMKCLKMYPKQKA